MKKQAYLRWIAAIVLGLTMLSTQACGAVSGMLATATPIPTNTPLPTDTPIPAPTATPEPTATLAPTAAAESTDLDFSTLVLTSKDLPSFLEVPAGQMDLENMALGNGQIKIKSAFTLVDQTTSQVLFGMTTYIPDPLQQSGFDVYIKNPELLSEAATQGMGAVTITEKQTLEVAQIGDSTGAVTLLTEISGVKMHMDMLVFRQGPVGAFIVNVYMDGVTPTTTVEEAARLLSERIKTLLP